MHTLTGYFLSIISFFLSPIMCILESHATKIQFRWIFRDIDRTGLGHGAYNCGRSSVSVSSYFSTWDRIFNISICLFVCLFLCPKTLLTCREKTADQILFKLGIYIYGITKSILFIFSGPKNDGGGWGPNGLKSVKNSYFFEF